MHDDDPVIAPTGSPVSWREVMSTVRILSQEQYEALLQANKIVEAAKAEAADIHNRALAAAREEIARECERERSRARQEILNRWRDTLQQWNDAASQLHDGAARAVLSPPTHEQIVLCAIALAEWYLRSELTSSDGLARHIKTLVAERAPDRCTVLRVHPRQQAAVDSARKDMELLADAAIEPDRTLEPGDLVLEYRMFRNDARISTVLKRGAEILLAQQL